MSSKKTRVMRGLSEPALPCDVQDYDGVNYSIKSSITLHGETPSPIYIYRDNNYIGYFEIAINYDNIIFILTYDEIGKYKLDGQIKIIFTNNEDMLDYINLWGHTFQVIKF